MALPVHKVAGGHLHAAVLPQKARVVPVRHEADVLAVGLVSVDEPRLAGALTDGGLVVFSHRQQQVGQLVLTQLVEDVALILAPVPAPEEMVFAGGFVKLHPGVVPGGQVIVSQQQRPLQQRAEFQAAVAVDAGIGGAPGAVFGHEVVHHIPGEPLRLVENVEFHTQAVGHAPGIGGIVGGAAGALHLAVIQAQHGAVAAVALLAQQQSGGGAVHPAGHGH